MAEIPDYLKKQVKEVRDESRLEAQRIHDRLAATDLVGAREGDLEAEHTRRLLVRVERLLCEVLHHSDMLPINQRKGELPDSAYVENKLPLEECEHNPAGNY